jgi:hypothetical protein
MTDMNEQHLANRIRQALNHGTHATRFSPRILERLRKARELALERQRVAPLGQVEQALDWATVSESGVLGRFGGVGGFSLRFILPTVLMVAGVIAVYTWQQERRAAEAEELDAQLLTDDLPIDAYLDRGFEAWLKKVNQQKAGPQ